MSLCERMCIYKGYVNNHIICECKIKSKFNFFLNANISKYNLIYRFESIQSNIFNFWVLQCYNNIFTKEVIISNKCSQIILGIIFINLIGIIIFCIKDRNILYTCY